MAVIEDRLAALGLVLPPAVKLPPGVALPFRFVRVVGARALISGHGPQAFGHVVLDVMTKKGTVTFSGSGSSGGSMTEMPTSSSSLRSTMIVEPGVSSAPRTKSASGSSMWRWIARRSGRAPMTGS